MALVKPSMDFKWIDFQGIAASSTFLGTSVDELSILNTRPSLIGWERAN